MTTWNKPWPRLLKDRWHIHLKTDPADPNRDIRVRCNATVCWAIGASSRRLNGMAHR